MSKRATKTRSSWSEKLDQSKGLPKVVPIGPTMSKQWGEGTVVVPAPREVDAIMKSVPVGQTDHDPGDPGDRGRAAWGDDRLSVDGRAFSPGSPRTRPRTTARPSAAGRRRTGGRSSPAAS